MLVLRQLHRVLQNSHVWQCGALWRKSYRIVGWRQIFIFFIMYYYPSLQYLRLRYSWGSPRPHERSVLPGSTRYFLPGTKMNSWIVLIMYGLSMYTYAYTQLQKRCRNHQFVIHDYKFLWGSMMLWWVNGRIFIYAKIAKSCKLIIKSAHILQFWYGMLIRRV